MTTNTTSRLAAYRERLSASDTSADGTQDQNPGAPGDENREVPPANPSNQEEQSMDEATKAALDAARTEGHTAALASANERMQKVFASEHFAGREAFAGKLLANAHLSAEEINNLLADVPKKEATTPAGLTEEQQQAAAEEAGRAEMRAALEQSQNSNIDAGDGGKPDKRAETDNIWAYAHGIKE